MSARLFTSIVKDDLSEIEERSINKSSVFTLCLLVSSVDNFCKQFEPRSDLTFTSGLILIQTA